MVAVIIIVVVVALLALLVVGAYNGIVRMRNQVDNGWSQIEVQIKRRADLIPNLVETVKGYAAHESGTFEAVVAARNATVAANSPAQAAAAEGPIASALGKKAIGLFAPMRPIHPGRWKPIGVKANYLVLNKDCSDCRKTMNCHCIREIKIMEVIKLIEK